LNECFAAESGPEVILGRWRKGAEQDRFDHHLPRQMHMASAIHRAHPAARQFTRDLVIADDFTDHCTVPGMVATGRCRFRLCTATWNIGWGYFAPLRFPVERRAFLRRPDNITAPRPGTPRAKCWRLAWRCVSVRRRLWSTRRSRKVCGPERRRWPRRG